MRRYEVRTSYLCHFGRSRLAESIWTDFRAVPAGMRNGIAQENSGTLPTSTNETAVLYVLPALSVSVGFFSIVVFSNAGRTLNLTVTTANSSPGLVIAFTRLSPGGQSLRLAVAARSTPATDISSPLWAIGLPAAD